MRKYYAVHDIDNKFEGYVEFDGAPPQTIIFRDKEHVRMTGEDGVITYEEIPF